MVKCDKCSTEEEIYPLNLDALMIGRKIDARMYGLEKELFVVRCIYKSKKFEIVSCGGVLSHNKDYEYCWAYKLQRYRIDKHGMICSADELGNIY